MKSEIVQFSTMQYKGVHCIVQFNVVRYSIVQCNTLKYSGVQYSAMQYSAAQYSAVQCRTVHYRAEQRTLKDIRCAAVEMGHHHQMITSLYYSAVVQTSALYWGAL